MSLNDTDTIKDEAEEVVTSVCSINKLSSEFLSYISIIPQVGFESNLFLP